LNSARPIAEAGSGGLQVNETAWLSEIIEARHVLGLFVKKVNDRFDGDLTPNDKLVYVNNVIKGRLLDSETLGQQAANNTKAQFANSPDLTPGLINAFMGALGAHTTMSTQALNSSAVQSAIKDILLNHARLYESLRESRGLPPSR
jgi:type I restriction enzyme R subunit